jgi:hypothetical protein
MRGLSAKTIELIAGFIAQKMAAHLAELHHRLEALESVVFGHQVT